MAKVYKSAKRVSGPFLEKRPRNAGFLCTQSKRNWRLFFTSQRFLDVEIHLSIVVFVGRFNWHHVVFII